MAIIFSKDLPTNELLNSHNNNIVKFISNNQLEATKCGITVEGVYFEITPNPNGVFKHSKNNNYKE